MEATVNEMVLVEKRVAKVESEHAVLEIAT